MRAGLCGTCKHSAHLQTSFLSIVLAYLLLMLELLRSASMSMDAFTQTARWLTVWHRRVDARAPARCSLALL